MASKHCFVTVGATASFHELVKAVLAPPFLKALQAHSYTDLVIQYGLDGKQTYASAVAAAGSTGVNITGFELDKAGLGRYMRQAKGSGKEAQEGVVISHAGKTSCYAHAQQDGESRDESVDCLTNMRRLRLNPRCPPRADSHHRRPQLTTPR